MKKTVKGLEEKFTVAVTISDVPEDDENEPVLLKNNDFAAPVEEITEMYALPGKHDIDPNAIMAFFLLLLLRYDVFGRGLRSHNVFGNAVYFA